MKGIISLWCTDCVEFRKEVAHGRKSFRLSNCGIQQKCTQGDEGRDKDIGLVVNNDRITRLLPSAVPRKGGKMS